jgi:hypothetical protein
MYKVQFINLEEDDKDPIVSFAIENAELGVKSLILHRTLFFEEYLDEEDRGVKVSLEGDIIEKEQLNVLQHINIMPTEIQIRSVFNEYRIDICRIDAKEVSEMLNLLKKQNYDNRFVIQVGSQ